jgi:hypothetical protein
MQIFLRLKHWQLFGLFFIWQIVSIIASITEQTLMAFITGLLFDVIFFGWLYTLGANLNKRLPNKIKMNLILFKWFIVILIIYVVFYGMFISNFWLNKCTYSIASILPFQFLAMFCMLYCFYFVAKSLKTVELQRPVTFNDYAGEFFLIMLFIIGIWFIQPRINKIFESTLQKNKKLIKTL